jgi:carboxymethylenebutenolidase
MLNRQADGISQVVVNGRAVAGSVFRRVANVKRAIRVDCPAKRLRGVIMAANPVQVTAADGKNFDAYVCLPEAGNGPGVIVIQEIFGINAWLRSVADWLAANGFLAVAPDLFHRQEPGIELTDQTDAEWQKAFQLYALFDENLGTRDLQDTVSMVRQMPECAGGKVGTIGFCLGGKLAYLMACRSDANANIGYYGVGIEKNLDEADNMKGALLLHIAEEDQYVPPPAQEQIQKRVGKNSQATIYVYQGMDHAFARVGGAHYNKDGAELANARSLDFLRLHLS